MWKENQEETIDKETDIYYYICKSDDMMRLTYGEYFACVKQRENDWTLEEESEDYQIINHISYDNEHDKLYKTVLTNSKMACYVINEALSLKGEDEITRKEIEPYNSSFITNHLENREADMVYKLKGRNIFFLIEHQSSVDYAMPYRIEEYKMEIKKSAINRKKARNKNYEISEVIAIVIYTGKQRWTVREYLNRIEDKRFRKVNLAKYNMIDINQYEKQKLLESTHFLDKVFLLEKIEDTEEAVWVMKKMIKQLKTKEEKRLLMTVMRILLREKMPEEKIEELIKKVKGEMLTMVKTIRAENRRIRKEGMQEGIQVGRREGIREMAKEMKQKGIALEMIKEITGFSEEEIRKIK